MKYTLLALLLMGCSDPKPTHLLKKGDCVQYMEDKICEKWQRNCKIDTFKVIQVGEANYQVLNYYSTMPHSYFYKTESFGYIDGMKKVDCWSNFGDDVGDEVYPEKD